MAARPPAEGHAEAGGRAGGLRRLAGGVARRGAAALGGGAAAFVFSELVFLNEGPVARLTAGGTEAITVLVEFVLIYAGFAYVTLVALWSCGVRDWRSLVFAGALMGWLIEGAVIPQVYEAPPLSFFWPSLGWHMTITFGVAWVALPLVMRNTGWGTQLALYTGAGIAWPGWGRLFFAEDAAMTLPGPAGFAGLAAVAGLVLIAGRWLADRRWARFSPGWADRVFAALLSVPPAVATGLAAGPVALTFFALVAVTLWAMARHGAGAPGAASPPPPRPMAYLRLAAFPLSAALTLPLIPAPPAGWSFVVILPMTLLATLTWLAAILGAIGYRPRAAR